MAFHPSTPQDTSDYRVSHIGKLSKPLVKVVRKLLLPYKNSLKTITTDNGPEFAAHKDITKYLGVPVYFTDPYCSWQKGTVENTNKLIRQ